MLQTVCGDAAYTHGNALEWLKWFQDGREDLQDDPRFMIHDSISQNADTIVNVREMLI
jgi:hypothetical protein